MGETVIVRVAQGSLRGQKVKTEAGATYYSFHAIPYAKPPVGTLRFKVSLIFLDIKATYRWISVLLCNCEWAGKRSRYSDWLRAGRFGDRIPVGARFTAPVHTGPGAHPPTCTMDTVSFLGVKSGRGVKLTPHPLLVLWS
jgi:hypothetical protein